MRTVLMIIGSCQVALAQPNAPQQVAERGSLSYAPRIVETPFDPSFRIARAEVRKRVGVKAEHERVEEFYLQRKDCYAREDRALDDPPDVQSLPITFDIRKPTNAIDANAVLDNSLAIGEDGEFISVTNGSVELSPAGHTSPTELTAFFKGILVDPCDPKVMYDPLTRRYVLMAQENDKHELKAGRSRIAVAFSEPDRADSIWSFYSIPFETAEHFDYPKMALTADGIYISGSTIGSIVGRDTLPPYSIVCQLDRFVGSPQVSDSLTYRIWRFRGLAGQPYMENGFALPITSIDSPRHHTGCYLVSTDWEPLATHVDLFRITGDVHNDSSTMTHERIALPGTYRHFCGARDKDSLLIDNLDMRAMDGFLLADTLVFIFTSGNEGNESRTNLCTVDMRTKRARTRLLGDLSGRSYCFPSINWLRHERATYLIVQHNSIGMDGIADVRCKPCLLDDTLRCAPEFRLGTSRARFAGTRGDTVGWCWGDYSAVASNPDHSRLLLASSLPRKGDIMSTVLTAIAHGSVDLSTWVMNPYEVLALNPTTLGTGTWGFAMANDVGIELETNGITTPLYKGLLEEENMVYQLHLPPMAVSGRGMLKVMDGLSTARVLFEKSIDRILYERTIDNAP